MKKIIIVTQAMEIGGAEKALLGLLENIDTKEYQVDLFLMRHSGELLKYIPDTINLLPEISEYAMLGIPIQDTLKKNISVFYRRIYGRLKASIYCKLHKIQKAEGIEDLYSHKYTVGVLPEINKTEYDLAISFLAPHYIVEKKVRAKKRVGWIHTDYETLEIDAKSELQMWNQLDRIVSISENVTTSFLKSFPSLENKIVLIQNIIPVKYMESLADDGSAELEMPNDGSIKILSVGRFCTAKNYDNVPEICKLLIEKGLAVTWYLIGYGPDEELIKRKISEFGMTQHVIILGKKQNPYPYFKRCDLYVQPSRFEGKCVSVIEAQMLYKPVVITDYATAHSQLRNGIDGIIVPMEPNECANGIATLINNPQKMRSLACACSTMTYVNKKEIDKIYALM